MIWIINWRTQPAERAQNFYSIWMAAGRSSKSRPYNKVVFPGNQVQPVTSFRYDLHGFASPCDRVNGWFPSKLFNIPDLIWKWSTMMFRVYNDYLQISQQNPVNRFDSNIWLHLPKCWTINEWRFQQARERFIKYFL